jgi:3-hydroxyacyl-[acyl-carrier-protein] dehydratase
MSRLVEPWHWSEAAAAHVGTGAVGGWLAGRHAQILRTGDSRDTLSAVLPARGGAKWRQPRGPDNEGCRQMNDTAPAGVHLEDQDAEAINRMIPHRYPFLMIDRVVEIFADTSAVGIKNVTINEPFFQGHFPGRPIMPGVLIVEAMAQTAAVLVVATLGPDTEGKLVYFMTIDQARFRRPVVPGDQLRVKVTKLQKRLSVWKFTGQASVGSTMAAEAVISAKIMDRP